MKLAIILMLLSQIVYVNLVSCAHQKHTRANSVSDGKNLSSFQHTNLSVLEIIQSDTFLSNWHNITYSALLHQLKLYENGTETLDSINSGLIFAELSAFNYYNNNNQKYRESIRGSFIKNVLIDEVNHLKSSKIKIIEITSEALPIIYLYMENNKDLFLEKYKIGISGWKKVKEKKLDKPIDFAFFLSNEIGINNTFGSPDENIIFSSIDETSFYVKAIFMFAPAHINFLEDFF